ncbi:MAG TPA: ATP-binding protein [Longimicrobium sp.]|nr:ATP-binding protein [Longimicrobium sp.]
MATNTTTTPTAGTPAAPRLPAAARLVARAVAAPLGAVYAGGELHPSDGAGEAARGALAALCARAGASGAPLAIEHVADAGGGIAAFVAAPLAGGGCVAAADTRPRAWSDADRAALADAAALLAPGGGAAPPPAAARQGISVFRAMFEGSASGLAVLDLGGRILRGNRALAQMLEVRAARLFGRPLATFLRGEGGAVAGVVEAIAAARDADVHDGLRLRGRGGRETWVRVKLTIRRRQGRPVFALAMIEDVGDRRRAAEALARRAAMLELMQRVSAAANRAGSLHEVLREALDLTCDYTGWPVGHVFVRGLEGELVSSGIWRLADPERFEPLRRATESLPLGGGGTLPALAAGGGAPVWIDDVQRHPGFARAEAAARAGVRGAVSWPIRAGGEVVAVAEFFSARPEHADPELMELLGYLGTQLGLVVEREQMLERLRESEGRLFQILEALPTAVVVRDADGEVYYSNRAARELVGRDPDRRVQAGGAGPSYPLFVTGTDQPYPAARLPITRAYAGHSAWVDDLELRSAGRRVPLRAGAAPIVGAGGRVEYVVGSFVDLSERVEMETALREHARELERSNRELEEFAYVASHDLQEPLRKIRAFGDRLRDRLGAAIDPDAADYLARMQAAAGRMQALIRDLLHYSRVGRARAHPEPVQLAEVLGEVLADLEPLLRDTGGRVEAGPLATVCADPTHVRQLLQNLVANALKFHRPGEPPRVTVRAAGGDGAVRLTVEDDGIGFEPGHAERIFLPFQRLHGRAEYEGTGMGLAICRRIAEAAGGSIRAEGRPGRGATFTVTLPRCAAGGEGAP